MYQKSNIYPRQNAKALKAKAEEVEMLQASEQLLNDSKDQYNKCKNQ